MFDYEPDVWLGTRGGSEHLARYDAASKRWIKITHENLAGWWVDPADLLCVPATPLQYLERLAAANHVFGDDIRFVGVEVGPRPYSCRITTSQPHVPGDAPNEATLGQWLADNGFQLVRDVMIGAYDATCWRRADVWLFDGRPMNFVESDQGTYPIDVIVRDLTP